MLFTYDQKELLGLLGRFNYIVAPENSQNPMLKQIKVIVEEHYVYFSGTDGEVSLTERIPSIEGNKIGHCTFPAKKLLNLVKNLSPANPIKVELKDDSKLQIRQGRSRYTLSSMDPTQFPNESIPTTNLSPINPEALLEGVSSVDYATYEDETRGALSGVLLEPIREEEGFIRAVASDGRRLATARFPGIIPEPLVISKKGAFAIKKILPGSREASICITENQVYLKLENSILSVRLMAQRFPNYKEALPSGGHNLLKVERAAILKILKRLCIFFENKTGSVNITLDNSSMSFNLQNEHGEANEDLELMPSSSLTGKIEFKVNPYFLQEAFDKLGGDIVVIKVYSAMSPILLFNEKNDMALVMPKSK